MSRKRKRRLVPRTKGYLSGDQHQAHHRNWYWRNAQWLKIARALGIRLAEARQLLGGDR